MLMKFRKIIAIILMLLGVIMLTRGLVFSFKSALGWQGIAQAVVVGSLVFALGFARWRFWSQR